MLLKELTALRGVSGDEGEVRSFIVDQAAPWCDEIKVDNMGSVIAWKHSKTEGAPTVMIDAHMDEVGFLVQYIRDDGMIRAAWTRRFASPSACASAKTLCRA